MERTFTKDMGKRFKKGDTRDYSDAVWSTIARNARLPLDKFTRRGGAASMVVKGDKAANMAHDETDAAA